VSTTPDDEPIPQPPLSKKETIGIKIVSTRFPFEAAAGGELFMAVRIENDGTESLEEVKIMVTNQELGIKTSAGPFDLSRGDEVTKTLLLNFPEPAQEGNYYLRFTITSNGETRRVIYRDVDIVSTIE